MKSEWSWLVALLTGNIVSLMVEKSLNLGAPATWRCYQRISDAVGLHQLSLTQRFQPIGIFQAQKKVPSSPLPSTSRKLAAAAIQTVLLAGTTGEKLPQGVLGFVRLDFPTFLISLKLTYTQNSFAWGQTPHQSQPDQMTPLECMPGLLRCAQQSSLPCRAKFCDLCALQLSLPFSSFSQASVNPELVRKPQELNKDPYLFIVSLPPGKQVAFTLSETFVSSLTANMCYQCSLRKLRVCYQEKL